MPLSDPRPMRAAIVAQLLLKDRGDEELIALKERLSTPEGRQAYAAELRPIFSRQQSMSQREVESFSVLVVERMLGHLETRLVD